MDDKSHNQNSNTELIDDLNENDSTKNYQLKKYN